MNIYQCHWSSTKEGLSLFLSLFGVVFSLFRPVLAGYGPFRVYLVFTSDKVIKCFLICKFTLNQLQICFITNRRSVITKWSKFEVLQSGVIIIAKFHSLLHWKLRKMALQTRAVTTWCDKYCFKRGQVSQSRAAVFTK